ncbi:DUF7281 domain-containing protein [Herminiimonas contaminans]|uniref:DUF7281 domain-containing protein n=1 Tax=Herminiimonas contaminans TaxID=1111140 RepID=A0ABS0EWD2_9BURK|nr:hypothetical protein [Herminiimonas contaminans]MBF8178394.1 hypothetical protein [Herminiimonas contaminans]
MTLTITQIKFLQDLIEKRPPYRLAGQAATFLSEHFAVGIIEGRRVEYDQLHFETAYQLLKNENLPTARVESGLRRAQSSSYSGLSEKYATVPPHKDSIAVRVASGKCRLDDVEVYTPAGTYLVANLETAMRISADRLMVVENLETFRHLEKQRWIDYGGLDVLAIFRGDTRFSTGGPPLLLNRRSEPVWAFYDFDPAGLALANMSPRLEKIVSPPAQWLITAARRAKRFDLYQDQLCQYEAGLNAIKNSEIRELWSLMKETRAGYPQEWMEACKSN